MPDKFFRSLRKTIRVNQVTGYQDTDIAPAFRSFRTLAEVEAEDIDDAGTDPGTLAITVTGHTEHGDCGTMIHRYVAAEPGHAGKVRSADGAWWELVDPDPAPQKLGALADGEVNDGAALAATVAFADRTRLTALYGLTTALEIPAGQALRGLNSRSTGLKLLSSASCISIGVAGNAAGVEISDCLVDGGDVADKLFVLGSNNKNNSLFRNIVGRNWIDVGLDVGANTDQTTFDRIDLGPARSSATTAIGLKHTGPGPIYSRNCSIFASNGIGWQGDWSCDHDQMRVNFHPGGLLKFVPGEAKSVATFRGVFLENCGVNAGDQSPVPVGSPVAVQCDGDTAPGGMRLLAPKRIQAGWAATHMRAINGGWIEIDCGVPWVGNNAIGSRALRAMDVGAAPGDGSYIRLNGPWRYDDWSRVSTLLRARPQSNGYPIRLSGGDGQAVLHTTDVGTTTGWTTSGTATGLTTSGLGIQFTCAGTDAYITRTIAAANLGKALGKALLLRVEATASGTGQLAMAARILGDGLTKLDSIISWQQTNGYGTRVYFCCMGFVDSADDIEIRIHGNASGDDASTATVVVHAVQLIALDADGPI